MTIPSRSQIDLAAGIHRPLSLPEFAHGLGRLYFGRSDQHSSGRATVPSLEAIPSVLQRVPSVLSLDYGVFLDDISKADK